MQIRTEALTELNFVVEGRPYPWCVYTRQGPQTEGYLKFKAYQGTVIEAARKAMKGSPLFTGPISLTVSFGLPFPDWAPKGAAARERWAAKHILKKPDQTNLLKGCEDGLSRNVWVDDAQVVRASIGKFYRGGPGLTIIHVEGAK